MMAFAMVAALVLPSVARGEDLKFHSGGRAHTLVESATEMYVRTAPDDATATRERLTAVPGCRVRSIPWALRSTHHCIVEVDKADTATGARLRAIAGVGDVRPVYRFSGSASPLLSTGNLVVKLDPTMTAAERTEFFAQFQVLLVNVLDEQNDVYTVRPNGGGDEVVRAAAMYNDDRTLFAHPDFIARAAPKQLSLFNDPFLNQQWHLNNTGQGGGLAGADIDIQAAWRITFGEDVLLGIFDDSVDVEHEDLLPNYIGIGHDTFLAQEGALVPNPRNIQDVHGTPVMGLAVADSNDFGVIGVAPAASFTASRGLSDPVSDGQIASAFVFARQRSVDVHINSWGFVDQLNSQADVLVSAIEAAFAEGREKKGMVIVFAAGNDAIELGPDDDLSALPEVIGVGASNALDEFAASYSNFGADIDVLAPSGDAFLPGMVTTDNTDEAGFVSPGFNAGGQTFDSAGNLIPDMSDSSYTRHFGGTSAACPVAAGVAALAISANQNLTATQVRTILEQTAGKIDAASASYHPITERSLTHAYGRINAGDAVQAAIDSRDNGGFTWPSRLGSVRISSGNLSWTVGDDIREIDDDEDQDTPPVEVGEKTSGVLVVESLTPFGASHAFVPDDGLIYSLNQEVATGITVVRAAGDSGPPALTVPSLSGTRYYALFPVNAIGRYGFGATIDTLGNVDGIGIGPGGDGGGSTAPVSSGRPRVSINVGPLSGTSPLEVRFQGNALSENTITSRVWDFGDGQSADRSTTIHRYVVSGAEERTFFPTFTVTDEFDNVGVRTVAVHVTGETSTDVGTVGDVRIVIGLPGSVNADVDEGDSPFAVELNVAGSAAGSIERVTWDLGDGGAAETISVPHTYVNFSGVARTLPISVEVVSTTSSGQTVSQIATRFITIQPDPNPPATDDGSTAGSDDTGGDGAADGGGAGLPVTVPPTCGAGVPVAFVSFLFLAFVRRRLH